MRENTGFIGGGNMAEALINGLISSKLFKPSDILVSDIKKERLDYLKKQYSIKAIENNKTLVKQSDILVLAIKPQDMDEVLQEIGSCVAKEKLVITIAAGIKLSYVEKHFPEGTPVIRVMPNTPALVRAGASAVAEGQFANYEDMKFVLNMMESVGVVSIVPEENMDTVTALSGSGPAYVFYLIEALIEAGIRLGLTPEVAKKLTVNTVLGAAKMVLETNENPFTLRQRVTSPGGTTEAGLAALNKGKFYYDIINAVEEATNRAKELGSVDA